MESGVSSRETRRHREAESVRVPSTATCPSRVDGTTIATLHATESVLVVMQANAYTIGTRRFHEEAIVTIYAHADMIEKMQAHARMGTTTRVSVRDDREA